MTERLAAYLSRGRSTIPENVRAEALAMIEQGLSGDIVARHLLAATTRASIERKHAARKAQP